MLYRFRTLKATAANAPVKTFFLLTVFAALYLAASVHLHHVASNDPGSLFFKPATAYTRKYSEFRRDQAQAYHDIAYKDGNSHYHGADNVQPQLCIGIASVVEDPARRLEIVLGSLLEGLSSHERGSMRFSVLLDERASSLGIRYLYPWLTKSVEDINWRNTSSDQNDRQVRRDGFIQLLQRCHSMNTPYIAIFEDSTIAKDGWYHQTMLALQKAVAANVMKANRFAYLELFYSEATLSWKLEHTLSYVLTSILCVTLTALCILVLKMCSVSARRLFTSRVITAILCICMPLSIALFFAAGRVTLFPPKGGMSISDPAYSSMSTGHDPPAILFPRAAVTDLLMQVHTFIDGNDERTIAGLLQDFAKQNGRQRWVLRPSVVQHIGNRRMKHGNDDSEQQMTADELFNIEFEQNDAAKLRRQHAEIIEQERQSSQNQSS